MPSSTVWWPRKSAKMVAVDLETTGLDRQRDRIIQVGLAGNVLKEPVSLLVDPECDVGRSPSQLRGVSQAELEGVKPFREYARELHGLLSGAVLVFHNKSGDLAFLRNAFRRCGMEMPPYDRAVCTLELCRTTRTPGSHKLKRVCEQMNVQPPEVWHNAKHDAAATLRLFISLVNRHPDVRDYFYNHEFECRSTYFLQEPWLAKARLAPVPRQVVAQKKRKHTTAFTSLRYSPPRIVEPASSDEEDNGCALFNFLKNGDSHYNIVPDAKAITPVGELKAAFLKHLKLHHPTVTAKWSKDRTPIRMAGFYIDSVHMCKVCGRPAKKEVCGEHYNPRDRTKLRMVRGMRLEKVVTFS